MRRGLFVLVVVLVSACGDDGALDTYEGEGYVDAQSWEPQRLAYLRQAASGPLNPESLSSVLTHLARDQHDPDDTAQAGAVGAGDWQRHHDFVRSFRDTSDFRVLEMLYVLYAHPDHPMIEVLKEAQIPMHRTRKRRRK